MSNCIFCQIINNDIPSYKVYEDDTVLAFLDISQTTKGHTLLIPKKHVEDIFGYNQELAFEISSKIPKIAKALKLALPEMRGLNILNNNGADAYQSVFHSHWHLIPRYSRDEDSFSIQFSNHMDHLSQGDYEEIQGMIKKQIKGVL